MDVALTETRLIVGLSSHSEVFTPGYIMLLNRRIQCFTSQLGHRVMPLNTDLLLTVFLGRRVLALPCTARLEDIGF